MQGKGSRKKFESNLVVVTTYFDDAWLLKGRKDFGSRKN